MNRYKWLAQYLRRMRNKGIIITKREYPFCSIYFSPRFSLEKRYDFLSLNYYLTFLIRVQSRFLHYKTKTFSISKENFETILEGLK